MLKLSLINYKQSSYAFPNTGFKDFQGLLGSESKNFQGHSSKDIGLYRVSCQDAQIIRKLSLQI